MNSDEARHRLGAARPDGADNDDPGVREALAQLQRDPELARWHAEQRAFDVAVARSLQSVRVPGDLREALLAARPRVIRRPVTWWRPAWNRWQARAALAAAIVLIAGTVAGMFPRKGLPRFADFRNELVEESWAGQSHLAFRSSDLIRVKQWLALSGGPTAFNLPPDFRQGRLHGCNIVDVGGNPVAVLCFAHGSRHLHLFVAEGVQFADMPQRGTPDFERCGPWKTTAWQDGKRTFVLTGMSYPAFVATFRKAGRWTMSG